MTQSRHLDEIINRIRFCRAVSGCVYPKDSMRCCVSLICRVAPEKPGRAGILRLAMLGNIIPALPLGMAGPYRHLPEQGLGLGFLLCSGFAGQVGCKGGLAGDSKAGDSGHYSSPRQADG